MPTKAQLEESKARLEEKMSKMQEGINKLVEANIELELSNAQLRSKPELNSTTRLKKSLEAKDNELKTLKEELQTQETTIQVLIGKKSDLRDEISSLKKRNYDLFSSNTLLEKKLTQANEALYKLISKV